jgi:hypothetical protein
MAIDSAGNAYVVGTMPLNGQDTFVAKLNASGSSLLYLVHFGGSDFDEGNGIAVDGAGNAYVAGRTRSANFPVTSGAFKTTFGGGTDAFVTKLNATGTALVYSTYLGGTESDSGEGIAVDAYGYAYVTGNTHSSSFPTTAGAFQTSWVSDCAFITELVPSGSSLYYSTLLGSGGTRGKAIAVDSSFNAYVTGETGYTSFPTTPGAVRTTPLGGQDVFVTKINAWGSGLYYSTYLGAGNTDMAGGIAVNSAGNAYVSGTVFSSAPYIPTTAGAIRSSPSGSWDAFVVQLNTAGSALSYSTSVGGSGGDFGEGIAVGSSGNAYVVGATGSWDFPTLSAVQPVSGGNADAFALKISGP